MKIKIINHPSIVFASPVLFEEGMMPYRIVIRHIPNDLHPHYAVQRENLNAELNGDVIEMSSQDFYWGHYCSTLDGAHHDFRNRLQVSGFDV